MNIALVAQSCDNETGIGRIVLSLATEFEMQGHKAFVVAQRFGKGVHGLNSLRVRCATRYNSINRLVLRHLTKSALASLNYDVANTFMIGRGASVVSAQSCHIAGIEIRNQFKTKLPWRKNRGIFDRITLQDEKALVHSRHTKRIIAVSQLVKEQLIHYYDTHPDHIAVIPNGVDVDTFAELRATMNRAELRLRYGFHNDDFLLLFVGNEFDRKGLDVLIRSLSIVDRRNVRLLVIGSDDPAPYVAFASSEGVADRVMFLGSVSGPEQFFLIADALVFPTIYEPFGMVILEAMAAGLPVIATRNAGALEGCSHESHGLFLTDPFSAEELSSFIERLVDHEYVRRQFAAAGIAFAQGLSWKNIAARTLRVYEQVRREL